MENEYKNLGNNCKSIITIPISSLKTNFTPFIPKNYKKQKKLEQKEFLESKNKLYALNDLEKEKKNFSGSESDSTSDETSPEKQISKKKYYINKRKENSIPFKGDAKDFKIKYKTELCKFYEIDGKCKYGGKCAYAHGKENLRSKVTNTTAYRTKKCSQFFEKGYCPYGNRCNFQHDERKFTDVNFSYFYFRIYLLKKFGFLKSNNKYNEKAKFILNKRLNVFKSLTRISNSNDKSLN